MDIAEPYTPIDDRRGSENVSKEESPQLPDLLPSISPQLAQETTGSLSPKLIPESCTLSSAQAMKDTDGALNECAPLLINSLGDHELQSEKDKHDEVYPSSAGTVA